MFNPSFIKKLFTINFWVLIASNDLYLFLREKLVLFENTELIGRLWAF